MWVRLKSPDMKRGISIPVPLSLASFALRCVPEEKLNLGDSPVTKEWILEFLREFRKELSEYKGLVLVEIQDKDGTYIKITV